MEKMPPMVLNTSKNCAKNDQYCKCFVWEEDDSSAVLSGDDASSNSCCKEHYFYKCHNTGLDNGKIDRKFRSGTTECNQTQTKVWSPDSSGKRFVENNALSYKCIYNDRLFRVARMPSAQIDAPSTFPPNNPSASTKSKAIGMPSATYAIVVALVLVRFVFLPLMISGQ
uniref:Ricin B-type lectin domain-containing protein n=1 Tax=Globodera pallida TaxID=36090 RepID=A0A183C8U4_GLOPA